jgi:hypothetical protein
VIDRGDATVGGAVIVIGGLAVGTATQVHSSLVGPILTFVGVILVALLTAWFTKQRQRADLAAERERQEKALEAENARHRQTISADFGRLDKQLAHDRRLADLADLRGVLDEAAIALDRAAQAHRPVGARVLADPLNYEGLRESQREIQEVRETCDALLARLRIRLGQDDPVTKGFAQPTEALHTLEASTIFVGNAPDEDRKQWIREEHFGPADRRFREGIDAFLDVAVRRAGTTTPDEEGTA